MPRKLPVPDDGALTHLGFQLPRALAARFVELAADRELSRSAAMRLAVRRQVERWEQEEAASPEMIQAIAGREEAVGA